MTEHLIVHGIFALALLGLAGAWARRRWRARRTGAVCCSHCTACGAQPACPPRR